MKEMIQDSINNRIDCAVEDGGIGSYAYGDGHYTDIRKCLALTNESVVVEYDDDEEPIETTIRGVYIDNESDLELMWLAELLKCEWHGPKKVYIADYTIQHI